MALLDNVVGTAIYGVAGSLGIKWLIDFLREERSARRGEKSESLAIKHLTDELERISKRVEQLEKDIAERDDELMKVNEALDEQRRLRREAEDELDKEKRARRALEDRVAELERKQ
ncbi:hypothetical protein [Burkholderia gladioli]|uniref:hypothetical protein n=1 Tax=Burkholderia gladioli TaxID=28095 RepID=UPI000BBD18E2|nr:hypothetical protein [Burkholderia gladioli]ATF86875.1 hypothetical protein CO712_18745 [Burkholderia gladioli pv. gladioli]